MTRDLFHEITEEVKKLEHIRWCRFHFINHWTYDALTGLDKSKDPINKKHKYLVSYEELPDEVKEYDALIEEIQKIIDKKLTNN